MQNNPPAMDEATRLRRKDTTKGPPLRVLSLDGGGVRGYSMLIILQELMHRTFVEIEGRAPKRHEIPKPCDHFDLIAGTGTGGLIAIMLGRLRLDLDVCKDLYVRLTRRVFETDKTFAGIPLKSTMFKASKLEEVIREVVRAHTVSDGEGNDTLANATPMTPHTVTGAPPRSPSQSSRYSQVGMSPLSDRRLSFGALQWGDPNALLYDTREHRTKTAVAAVLRGTSTTALLRSYDSRKEPAPETNCTIWQAGRATSATAMAFKPIQIGQSVYLDEGAGRYNPAPAVLDEAAVNEWPGREVGVFVSIGTGKRPAGGGGRDSHEWWEGLLGGSVMGDFAEARRRLVAKLEACEATHEYMLREHLAARAVPADNYFRLNVEIGVGEFGMNEWARLSEISTNTRTYLARRDVEARNQRAAVKMAKIHLAKVRHDRAEARREAAAAGGRPNSWEDPWDRPLPAAVGPSLPPSNPSAVELPGDDLYYQTQSFRPGSQQHQQPQYEHRPSVTDQKYIVVGDDQYPPPPSSATADLPANPRSPPPPRPSHDASHAAHRSSPPPLPPKTPLSTTVHPSYSLPYPDQEQQQPQPNPVSPQAAMQQQINGNATNGPRTFMNMGDLGRRLPYPDVEGPPPEVNWGSKPQGMSR